MRPIVLVVAASLAGPAAAGEGQKFGKPLQGLSASALEMVLAKPEAGRVVRLEGTIAKVCKNKGCWLELKQGGHAVHVTFEGYSFFVPKDSDGKAVVLEGRVVVAKPKPEAVRHLEAEGATAAAAEVSIEATGVEIR